MMINEQTRVREKAVKGGDDHVSFLRLITPLVLSEGDRSLWERYVRPSVCPFRRIEWLGKLFRKLMFVKI